MKVRVASVMLGCFLAADVVLVALALRPPAHAPTPLTGPGTQVSSSNDDDPSSRPTGSSSAPASTRTGTPGSTSSGATPPVALAVTIAALDDAIAWRGTVGSCAKGGATVELTTDGGKTWSKAKSPARAVVRVQPLDAERAFAVAADDDCGLVQFTSPDGGKTWEGPQAVEGGWARRLDEPDEAVTPALATARPCGDTTVIDLSRTSAQQAEALCANGKVKVTNDGGTTWTDSGSAPGGLALSNRLEDGVLSTYVARVVPDCDGVEIIKVIAGADPRRVACVASDTPTAGRVALSVTSSSGWLRVGGATFTAPRALTEWDGV